VGERISEQGGLREEAVLVATQRRCISEECSLEKSSFIDKAAQRRVAFHQGFEATDCSRAPGPGDELGARRV